MILHGTHLNLSVLSINNGSRFGKTSVDQPFGLKIAKYLLLNGNARLIQHYWLIIGSNGTSIGRVCVWKTLEKTHLQQSISSQTADREWSDR